MFDIAAALTGAVEGFLLTGNPLGAGVMALADGLDGQNAMPSLMAPDSILTGGGDSPALMAFSQIAEIAG